MPTAEQVSSPRPITPELRADNCWLRPWRAADAEAVYELCQDPLIQQWTAVPSPYTVADSRAFVSQPPPVAWAVCAPTTGEIVASVGLKLSPVDPLRAELGYWCAAHARGRGLVTAASRAACRWGFETQGLQRIEWFADVGNEGSWRVAHQIGFRFEGRIRGRLLSNQGTVGDAWGGAMLPGEVATERVALPWGSDPVLSKDAVTVRRWRESDIPAYARLQSDPDVMYWNGTPADQRMSIDLARQHICEVQVERWMTGSAAAFAIVHDGEVAGGVGLIRRHQRLGELGWWLGKEFRGKGAASQAVRLVVAWAATVGLERLEARVHVDNPASQAVAERAGLRREGRLSAEAPYVLRRAIPSLARDSTPRVVTTTSWGDAYIYADTYGLLTAGAYPDA